MEVSTKVGELIQVYDYIGEFGNRHNLMQLRAIKTCDI